MDLNYFITNFLVQAIIFLMIGFTLSQENNSKKFKLKLKCSLKLFPLPLKKIGKLIGDDSEKIDFPHEFVKEDNYLTYEGTHPKNDKIIK